MTLAHPPNPSGSRPTIPSWTCPSTNNLASSRYSSTGSKTIVCVYVYALTVFVCLNRYKEQTERRISQTDDLLGRLERFEQQYSALCGLIAEGNELLDLEKPVGDTAQRIAEQTETCQVGSQRFTVACV